jgi:hypothetical protein
MTKTLALLAAAVFVLLLLTPLSAFAQDEPKAGLVFSNSSTFSILWRVSDTIALRPEIAFSRTDNSSGANESDNTTLTPGVAALIYMSRWDNVRTYVSPRYAVSRLSASNSSPGGSNESSNTAHAFSGSIGAEYAAHRRFGVFGEVGVAINRLSVESQVSTQHSTTISIRSVVGGILFF